MVSVNVVTCSAGEETTEESWDSTTPVRTLLLYAVLGLCIIFVFKGLGLGLTLNLYSTSLLSMYVFLCE